MSAPIRPSGRQSLWQRVRKTTAFRKSAPGRRWIYRLFGRTVAQDVDRLPSVIFESNGQQSEDRPQMRSPVFIISVMQRCGSNFLCNILRLHPDLQWPRPLAEDRVLKYSPLLLDYVNRTYQRWKPWIKDSEENIGDGRRLLLSQLGNGILSFMSEYIGENKRLLVKSPEAYNIDNFFLLFPQARLLILVRDGRDAVESAMRSWPNRKSYAHWMKRWAEGTRLIVDFMQGVGHDLCGKSWKLIKYEDLVEDPEVTVRDLLDFLKLDAHAFDWQQLERLPLRGSSTDRAGGRDKIYWGPLERPKDFRPIGRWEDWSWWRKWKFKKIAGREMMALGYVSNNRW